MFETILINFLQNLIHPKLHPLTLEMKSKAKNGNQQELHDMTANI